MTITSPSSQPSSGPYITVTGGNSATTGSATAGESCTVTKTAGYIAAGTSTVSSTATASANASSKTVYYTVANCQVTNNTTTYYSYVEDIPQGRYIVIGSGYNASTISYRAAPDVGTKTITAAGTTDVTGYSMAQVAAGTLTVQSSSAQVDTAGSAVTTNTDNTYVPLKVSGSGIVKVSTAGYLDAGANKVASASNQLYIKGMTITDGHELDTLDIKEDGHINTIKLLNAPGAGQSGIISYINTINIGETTSGTSVPHGHINEIYSSMATSHVDNNNRGFVGFATRSGHYYYGTIAVGGTSLSSLNTSVKSYLDTDVVSYGGVRSFKSYTNKNTVYSGVSNSYSTDQPYVWLTASAQNSVDSVAMWSGVDTTTVTNRGTLPTSVTTTGGCYGYIRTNYPLVFFIKNTTSSSKTISVSTYGSGAPGLASQVIAFELPTYATAMIECSRAGSSGSIYITAQVLSLDSV